MQATTVEVKFDVSTGSAVIALNQIANKTNEYAKNVKQLSFELDKSSKSISELSGMFKSMTAANLASAAVSRLAGALKDFITGSVEAVLEGQKIQRTLEYAGASFQFVKDESDRLGLNLRKTASDFSSLSAAARGTTLEGQASQDIFTGVTEAMTVMGGTADQTSGALLAIQQMISKGTVQAEELRGQLGERLPGAFQIAARSMNTTTQGLGKMLEKGEVVADVFLPKFAAELHKTFGKDAVTAAGQGQSAINRFQTAMFELSASFGQGFSGELFKTLDEFNSFYKENGETIKQWASNSSRFLVSFFQVAQGASLAITTTIAAAINYGLIYPITEGVQIGTAMVSGFLDLVRVSLKSLPPSMVPKGWNESLEKNISSLKSTAQSVQEFQNSSDNLVKSGYVASWDLLTKKVEAADKAISKVGSNQKTPSPAQDSGAASKLKEEMDKIAGFEADQDFKRKKNAIEKEKLNDEINARNLASDAEFYADRSKLQEEIDSLTMTSQEREAQSVAQHYDTLRKKAKEYFLEESELKKETDKINKAESDQLRKSEKQAAQERIQNAGQMATNLISAADSLFAHTKKNAILNKALAIAQIGVNTALAISNALAMSGPPWVGIAMAATVGALGVAQAVKASQQKFANGGIVQGDSTYGDKIPVFANAGEMILNASDQKTLFGMIKAGNRGEGGNTVHVTYAPTYSGSLGGGSSGATFTDMARADRVEFGRFIQQELRPKGYVT